MVLGRQTIPFGTRKTRVPAAKVLYAPAWPCLGGPRWVPKWPKITKNGPRCLRTGPQKVPLSKLMGKTNLGTFWVAFWPCLDLCGPKMVSVGPKWVHLGPECVLRAETEKRPYLRLDGPDNESVDTFATCKPPL